MIFRVSLVLAVIVLGIGALLVSPTLKPQPIALADAVIEMDPDDPNLARVYLTVVNSGPPDFLMTAGSPIAGRTEVTEVVSAAGLPMPGGSALLASDGAHIRLMSLDGPLQEGQLVPVTLNFETTGPVTIRAKVGAMTPVADHQMEDTADHTMGTGPVEIAPSSAPVITLTMSDETTALLAVDGITLSEAAMGKSHETGSGHGHLYLDGVKIGRVFGGPISLPKLAPGSREIRVTLFTNDHRPYLSGDMPVGATLKIIAP